MKRSRGCSATSDRLSSIMAGRSRSKNNRLAIVDAEEARVEAAPQVDDPGVWVARAEITHIGVETPGALRHGDDDQRFQLPGGQLAAEGTVGKGQGWTQLLGQRHSLRVVQDRLHTLRFAGPGKQRDECRRRNVGNLLFEQGCLG